MALAVHVFCEGMDNHIRAKLHGTAKYGSGKGIVNKKRQTVAVGKTGKSFDVQNAERGAGQCFAKTVLAYLPRTDGLSAISLLSLLSFWSPQRSFRSMPKRRTLNVRQIESSAISLPH